MIYNIYHKTEFDYENMVTFSHNIARLKPKNTAFQKLLNFSMQTEPSVYEESDFVDIFGNNNMHILIREAHQSLSLIGNSRVEIFPEAIEAHIATVKSQSVSYAQAQEILTGFAYDDTSVKLFMPESELIPKASKRIQNYALESFSPYRDMFESACELMNRIYADFKFVPGFSDVMTPIEDTFDARQGVCQDFTQFAIAALRSIGLPACYMSGYIETIPNVGEVKLFGADASHAWFALYIPNAGWIGFDPTNNIIPTYQHILLGSGRDYHDISPLKGVVLSSGKSNLSIMVDVQREAYM